MFGSRGRLERRAETILQLFRNQPDKLWYGLELAEWSGVGPAAVYPALVVLERRGLVHSGWSQPDHFIINASTLDERQVDSRRRLYSLTEKGRR